MNNTAELKQVLLPKVPKSVSPGKYAAKRDTHNPCAVCGGSSHMGIHKFPVDDKFDPPFFPHQYQERRNG